MEHRNPAISRVVHAGENVSKLEHFIQETPPFAYYVETDLLSGHRATFAKCDDVVAERIALSASDIVHELRSALDNAYWGIVSPFARNAYEEKKVQFPFSKTAADLERELRTRLADRVGQEFFNCLIQLKPFQEVGGNLFLALVHWMNIKDKHRHLIPLAEFKTLSTQQMQKLIPDFPSGFINVGLGQNFRDVVWQNPAMVRKVLPPAATRVETRVEVPVETMFSISEPTYRGPVIATLHEMVAATRNAIKVISDARPHT